MADRKASQEPKAVALGSADFWAAVQGGADVQISVQQIYDFVRNGMVGASSGKAPTLGSDGKLDASVIPAVAINDTFVVADQAAMLALTAERGDIAVRTDQNRSYVLKTDAPGTLANWQELLTPTDAVLSVAGLTGAITPAALRVAIALSITDISGLRSALDALSAADATLRSDFGSADASIRADMTAGLATKFDKTGGTVSGNVAATGSLSGAYAKVVSASDAIVEIESTGAPDTSYRRKQIYSSTNVGGGNNWLFRMTRPSDGAAQDFVFANGTGGTVWTTGNFNPALKADLNASVSFSALIVTGATSLATLTTSGLATLAGLTVSGAATFANQTISGASTYGSVTRQMVNLWGTNYGIGVQSNTAYIRAGTEFAVHQGGVHSDAQGDPGTGGINLLRMSGTLFTYKGNTIWNASNFNPDTKANLAGATFTGSVGFSAGATMGGWLNLAGSGTQRFEAGNGDDATLATHNMRLVTHFGFGIADFAGTVRAVYNARSGFWNTTSAPQVNGQAVWWPGNFDPNSKINLAGGAPTGQVAFKASVGGTIASRTGDGSFLQVRDESGGSGAAAMTFHRSGAYATWFGLDTDNEFRRGGWSDGAASYRFWTEKNFNPDTKATLGTTARFNGIFPGPSEAYFYTDGNTNNVRMRAGAGPNYKYAGLNDDGLFQLFNGGLLSAGDVRTNGRLVVGEGQISSMIEMRDTDEGTRYVHNNSGSIGFLGSDGNWKFRAFDNGSIWCAQLGDINTRIETRAADFANDRASYRVSKTGDTMTGNLTISGAYPITAYFWGGVIHQQWMVDSDGAMVDRNGDNGYQYYRFQTTGRITSCSGWRLETDGNIYMPWYGDYLSTALARKVDVTNGGRQDIAGALSINGSYLDIVRGGVLRARWIVDGSGNTILQNGDNGDNFFYVSNGGAIWTKQFGDLNNRIEGRADAYANMYASRITARWTYAGDLGADWNANAGNYAEPYGGAALTSLNNRYSTNPAFYFTAGGRWRYLQMKGSNDAWYTVGYA